MGEKPSDIAAAQILKRCILGLGCAMFQVLFLLAFFPHIDPGPAAVVPLFLGYSLCPKYAGRAALEGNPDD